MQVKIIAELNAPEEHSAILSTCIKLPFVIKIFILSTLEWSFYTGFTVFQTFNQHMYRGKKMLTLVWKFDKYEGRSFYCCTGILQGALYDVPIFC